MFFLCVCVLLVENCLKDLVTGLLLHNEGDEDGSTEGVLADGVAGVRTKEIDSGHSIVL